MRSLIFFSALGLVPIFANDSPAAAPDLAKSGNILPTIPHLTPEQEAEILKDVKVAEGFDVSLFATPASANYPVYVAASPAGDLYVSSDGNGSLDRDANRGRILRLRDSDGDGRADQVTEFVKSVDSPRGLVWDKDRLYLVHPPTVSCYIDHDGDGISDEEKTLITGIAFDFKNRPADHTTNGLTMGIDGWLYIAGGDFGFVDAVGTDGKHLQHRGGGVLRFRPDGSGLEIFADGTRNILATPISPLLDIFSRDNTNDGGGWDVRFHHFTGLEDHGYPRLYMNFGDEIVQPLADYGGGSGCGAVYISEPGIPAKWNDGPFTCDWGTGALWHHTVSPYGATFRETAKPEPFIKMTRPTDADVDGMSAIYQASWKGATFTWQGPDVGYIVRVTPHGYTPEPLPDFPKAMDSELVRLLESPSQVRTLAAQRELLTRPELPGTNAALRALAGDSNKALPARVAALYTLTQKLVDGEISGPLVESISALAADPQLQRFVLRALADAGLAKISEGESVAPEKPFAAGLKSDDARTRLEAVVGAARQNLIALAPQIAGLLGDPDPVLAHTSYRALARMNAADACFAVLNDANAQPAQVNGALRALMRMHRPEVVKGLADRAARVAMPDRHLAILSALARLYFHEGEWKGDSWGTRPDTRGPYYQPETWIESPAIATLLKAELAQAGPDVAPALARELLRNRIEFTEALDRIAALVEGDPKLLPDLVAQLAAVENVQAKMVPYLLKAATSELPAKTISQAISSLVKTDSADGWEAIPAALARLREMKDSGREFDQALASFLAAPKLENYHQALEKIAEAGAAGAIPADAALLQLSASKTGSPEARKLSEEALNAGWAEPNRRLQILLAIRMTKSHALDAKVLAAASEPDSASAKSARKLVKLLKLTAKVADKTPIVGTLSPDKAIARVGKTKGDAALGKEIFTRQTCVMCHAVSADQPQIGPYLGNIAQTYSRAELAANILDPGKTIAQGFATEVFTLQDGSQSLGFVTFESAGEVKVRNMAGQESVWKTGEITKREKVPVSMMPPGLAAPLTVREFASLLDYLESLSKK